jgi:glycosyltransferase involved in cell wall biosynthesis
MRIIIINKYAHVTGGADRHCLELIDGLKERGHDVAMLSTASKQNLYQQGAFISPTVTSGTRAEIGHLEAVRVAYSAVWNRRAAETTKNLFTSFRPDIVHAHKLYPQLSVAPIIVASRCRVPIIQTLHDYEFISASSVEDSGTCIDRDEATRAYRLLNTALFQVKRNIHVPRIDQWISVSRSTDEAYREHGITTNVLPNFTPPFSGSPVDFDQREGVLFVGRLAAEKGLRNILSLPEYIPKIPIVIAGEGPLLNEVKQAAQNYPSVTYLGKLDREATSHYLSLARLVLMPSLWREPGPLVALETMAVGTPLIACDRGGLAEYVADANAGIILNPSVTSLADAVLSLYDDRRRWERFSSNAQQSVLREHSRPIYIDRLEAIYANSLERAKRLRKMGY